MNSETTKAKIRLAEVLAAVLLKEQNRDVQRMREIRILLVDLFITTPDESLSSTLFSRYGDLDEVRRILSASDQENIPTQLNLYREQLEALYEREQRKPFDKLRVNRVQPPAQSGLRPGGRTEYSLRPNRA